MLESHQNCNRIPGKMTTIFKLERTICLLQQKSFCRSQRFSPSEGKMREKKVCNIESARFRLRLLPLDTLELLGMNLQVIYQP